MSILKVIEVMADSPKSWEDAAQQAVSQAAATLHNIRSVYIQDHSAVVQNDHITAYRVTAKITFEIEKHNGSKKG